MAKKTNGQLTGMRGVYLVAAKLCEEGFIASPTSRSARGAYVLVTDQSCSQAWTVQVKTNATTFSFWLLNAKTKEMCSEHHVYALVNLRPNREPEYFIVPSQIVAARAKLYVPSKTRSSVWHAIYLDQIREFQDNWKHFKQLSTAASA